jgi:hypothetical protein
VNGGSFSVVAAKKGSTLEPSPAVDALLAREVALRLETLAPYREFEQRVLKCRDELLTFIDKARRAGERIAVLGASTKGNVLLQYCGITPEQIAKVGEVNVEKYGCFTPGTLLPIVPQEELLAENPDYLLVLPWHFRRFFEANPKFKGRKLVFPLPDVKVVAT